MKKSLLAVLLLWTAQLDSGYYLGVGIGQLDYQDDGFGLDIDESTNASKLYGGFRFDDTWALEASYGEFGDIDWSLSAFDPNVGTLSVDLTAGWSLLEVRGIAHIRAFYVGAGYWDADIDFDFTLTEPGMVTTGV